MYIVKENEHISFIKSLFLAKGYSSQESEDMAKISTEAGKHGIKTHNALKANHLDDLFGINKGGTIPNAKIEVADSKYKAIEKWNSNKKLGPSVAYKAIDKCIKLADNYGVGMVVVENAWHYLWGGGYVLEIANRGLIGYTTCTAMLSEVVPYKGKYPSIGTNPHSWSFPTKDFLNFNILIDWATSKISMGKVQQLKRDNSKLPDNACVNKDGIVTLNPEDVNALLPFGEHKGYGLGLLSEIYAGYIGGYKPKIRGRFNKQNPSQCQTPTFLFKAIHPDALSVMNNQNRSIGNNIRDIVEDILEDNENSILPGELEYKAFKNFEKRGGLEINKTEYEEYNNLAEKFNIKKIKVSEV
tara:strand:- start:232 stop:1299 length:1068 start_codon:yes stop_codon:yes gene_type:complete